MKKQFILGLLVGISLIIPTLLFAQPNLTAKLAGRILLQVENRREAWYEAINKSCYSSNTYDYTKELRELEMKNYLEGINESLKNISWQLSW
ncbi:MAG: hypothetical protein Q8L27_02990 [archaeon]|nr:hypothetical protein [archaeon]